MFKYFKIMLILLAPMYINAHTLVLNLLDNEDDTITIIGAFSTGESASGALIKLQATNSKEILFKQRLDEESEVTIKIPNIAYDVILDAGKGHTVEKEGIAPQGGFKKEDPKKNTMPNTQMNTILSKAIPVGIIVSLLLLIATIIVSIFNTRKLLKEVQ